MTTTPARQAVISALMWPNWNPTSESYGSGEEKANELIDAAIAEDRAAHAAEVRAAAFDQAADAVQSDGVRLNTAATEAAARRGPVALIAHVQAAVADHLRRMAAAVRPDAAPETEAHPPHVDYVLERAISDGWVEEHVVDDSAAAVQAAEDYDGWWLLPATLRIVRRTTVSAVVSVHEVAKPGPCTCGHTFEQHLLICGRSRQCRSLCDCDAYRPDNTPGA